MMNMRYFLFFLLLFFILDSYSQKTTERKILEDGTLVKIYSNKDIELKFPQGKQIISAYITREGEVTPTYLEDSTKREDREVKGSEEDQRLMAPSLGLLSVDIGQLDDSTREVFSKARMHYFEYFSQGYQHRQKVFRWQLLSSKIIFVIVVILVFAGIVFAAIQFYDGMKHTMSKTDPVTTFEAGKEGLKVSSPILGVIILVISLAFFYLYLVYVYPIEEIF